MHIIARSSDDLKNTCELVSVYCVAIITSLIVFED